MPTNSSEQRRLRWIGGAGACAVVVFLWLVGRFWHPVYGFTSFLQLDQSTSPARIAAIREQPVFVYRHIGLYDGLFYAELAHHPLLNSPELPPAMDDMAYRARRILPAALAWLLAGGNLAWIFNTYCIVNIIAWLALAPILWRLLDVRDARTWIAWAGVLFSAGALISVRRALVDLVALACIAGSMLLLQRGRRAWSALVLGASGLCRETSLLAAVNLAAAPASGGPVPPRAGARSPLLNRVAPALLALAPLGAWLVYVRLKVGGGDSGWENLTWPFRCFVSKWCWSLAELPSTNYPLLAGTSLLALVGLTAQALYICVHRDPRDAWWRLGAAYLVLMSLLGPAVWADLPSAAFRVLLPMTLAFNVMAAGRRASIGWLVIGNLTVASGLLALEDVPRDDLELCAVRSHGSAGVVRQGPGWFGKEHSASHEWLWTSGTGRLGIEAWPRDRPKVALQFSVRSLTARTVTIGQGGVPSWSGVVGKYPRALTVEVRLIRGRADLDFSCKDPPTPATPGGDLRPLSFAVYDARLILDPVAATGN